MKLEKFSFVRGDRFAHQGEGKLKAVIKAKEQGIDIIPLWNNSNREQKKVKTDPAGLRAEADAAVKTLGWRSSYINALGRFDELCLPYATVIDIKESRLPGAEEVKGWSGERGANSLRHNQQHPDFNLDFRQKLHVAYKVAGENGDHYYAALNNIKILLVPTQLKTCMTGTSGLCF